MSNAVIVSERNEQIEASEVGAQVAGVALPASDSYFSMDSDEMDKIVAATLTLDKLKPMVSVKLRYKNFTKEGESCRGIFIKIEKIPNGSGELLESVLWFEQDGKAYYNSGIILVDLVKRAQLRKGVGIEITYIGKKKRTSDFDVVVLQRGDTA